jgi:hypothetical protein
MSVSQHPVALRLEQQVGGATKLLATVMALPLVDGIFPALVIAGALTYPFGIIETGLLIFGGSATVAVILAEMDGSTRDQVKSVLLLGAVLVPAAAAEAAIAPTIQSLVDLAIFERFAGLVILAIAAKTASAKVGEYLPRPAVIIGLGLVASFQPNGAELVFLTDTVLVAKAAAAAGTGVAFALGVALFGQRLRGAVDLDLFRFGSSVALGMLALSVLMPNLLPTKAPVALIVLGVTGLFAYDPGAEGDVIGSIEDAVDGVSADEESEDDNGSKGDDGSDDANSVDPEAVLPDIDDSPLDEVDPEAVDVNGTPHTPSGSVADGGESQPDSAYGYPAEEESRAPWL